MIKQVAVYIISFTFIAIVAYNLHALILADISHTLPFSLYHVYFFHTIFSSILCIGVLFLSKKDKYRDQLGFIYIASVLVKIIIFCIIFNDTIFGSDVLTTSESINLLIPMFLFLIVEAFFIIKRLNTLLPLKNDN